MAASEKDTELKVKETAKSVPDTAEEKTGKGTAEENQGASKSAAKRGKAKDSKKEGATTAGGVESDKKPAAKKRTAKTSAEKSAKSAAKKGTAKDSKKEGATAAGGAESDKKPAAKKRTAKTSAKKSTAKKSTTKRKSRSKKFAQFENKTLVIVESPAKAKTLEKILGRKYKVLASIGHVRDLPKGRLAIDLENGFEPEYIKVRGKAEIIRNLKGASDASSNTLLAADPDREGESIAWHIAHLLEIDPASKCRIRMHEITKHGVTNAVKNPDSIDLDRVDAQQARRVLDRLVGYQLSPLLWNKVQRGLSAGRVQSVALRLVCEREDEIDKFVPEEYYLVDVMCESEDGKRDYKLRLDRYKDKPVKIGNAAEADKAESEIKASGVYVDEFRIRDGRRSALPPLKTSTLQQEASRRFGYAPRRTMRIAQALYEGIDLPGKGPTGLITYMRTDSLRLAPEAVTAARKYIDGEIGAEYLSKGANSYTSKEKSQDAHEAIRATDPYVTPQSIKEYLQPDQYRIYELIWSRYVASQMSEAKLARTTLICKSGDYQLKQTGVEVVFEGWGKIVPLGVKEIKLPKAIEGERLEIEDVKKEQRFTQPPSRYTEAGLVKLLEEKGIGRPSTYATIMETLSARNYVARGDEDKKLSPTKLGRIVNTFLVTNFPGVIDTEFTATMEGALDRIEGGELLWRNVIARFWESFKPVLDDVSKNAKSMRPEPEKIGEKCPECGEELVIKNGRYGEFIACMGYPDCRYTRKLIRTIGVKCPKCEEGELVRRRAMKGKAKGRFFYSCSRYPDCDYSTWKKPAAPQKDKNDEKKEEDTVVSDI
jgi:DNA topoisomerase-1